ncbi:AraC-like ligand-binding domain-containing protein [Streptacidiphilus griseoplanus]|uniref:AraC-like ligand-binding domain-containing protein n=1 Tax=Peterkaempfera griseoplana TaxID=66896 RepID=UPI0006E27318|nr:helix-turn-helix domain-containing protein [Peterkaempfera griseoplana]
MIQDVFNSDSFPPDSRFEQWCEVSGRGLLPLSLSTAHPEEFRGGIRQLALGPVQVTEMHYTPMSGHRLPVHVRRSDPDLYQLSLVLRGTVTLEHRRRQGTAAAGDMQLFGTWHPYAAHAAAAHGTVSHLVLQVPRTAMPLSERQAVRFIGSRLPAHQGVGALLARLLTETVARGPQLRPSEAVHLGGAALELAAAFLADLGEAVDALSPETRQSVLVTRIRAFIDQHLADPDLGPPAIAAAHHISVRYLHLLFQRQGTTVSSLIQQSRLERCRRDLADPASSSCPIYAIANRWGFAHPEHFTRLFRSAYGISPRDYRRTQQAA